MREFPSMGAKKVKSDKIEKGKRIYKGGIPEHVPSIHTRSKVMEFVCAGFKQQDIAMYFDMDEKTLRKHYRNELDKSHMKRTAKLGKNLYLDALRGDKASREFWLKTQGRWSYAKPPDDEKGKGDTLLEKFLDAFNSKNG